MTDNDMLEFDFEDEEAVQNGSDAPVTPVAEPVESGVMRTVKLLNTDVFDGNYAVVDANTGKGYLVPTELLNYSVGEQRIEESTLLVCESLYNWDIEISELLVSVQDIRIALWMSGLVTPKEVDMRGLVGRLLRRGTLPVV